MKKTHAANATDEFIMGILDTDPLVSRNFQLVPITALVYVHGRGGGGVT